MPLLSEVSMPPRGPWVKMPRKGPQNSFPNPKHRQVHQSTHKPKARDRTQHSQDNLREGRKGMTLSP